MPPTQLSNNSVDIESFLRGTGTTNLVNPKPDTEPNLIPVSSLNIADRIPLLLPKPLFIEPEQRPLW
jgi:hypothetical protein